MTVSLGQLERSSTVPTCSARPGKAEEVGKIEVVTPFCTGLCRNNDEHVGPPPLILVHDTDSGTGQFLELDSSRMPFAIRCSGHSGNPGFSSCGVQISMASLKTFSARVKRLSRSERVFPGPVCIVPGG